MEEKRKKQSADQVVKEIKRRIRRTFTAEEKIKIVLKAMLGEDTIDRFAEEMLFMQTITSSGERSL